MLKRVVPSLCLFNQLVVRKRVLVNFKVVNWSLKINVDVENLRVVTVSPPQRNRDLAISIQGFASFVSITLLTICEQLATRF